MKLELLNDDMMKEFDILIAQQTKISDDIQSKLHSTLEILEKRFQILYAKECGTVKSFFFDNIRFRRHQTLQFLFFYSSIGTN